MTTSAAGKTIADSDFPELLIGRNCAVPRRIGDVAFDVGVFGVISSLFGALLDIPKAGRFTIGIGVFGGVAIVLFVVGFNVGLWYRCFASMR